MLEWFDREATSLAAAFDARNGNRFYSDQLSERKKWLDLVEPLPLPAKKPKRAMK